MKRAGGYTVIEVMIFLTISAVIFISAQLVFQGQQGRTEFQQGMHDIASKLQQYVAQVGTSLFPGAGTYSCSIGTSGRATLSPTNNGQIGGNQACIFLGNAEQVLPGQGNLYTYTVLGNEYKTLNGSTQTEPVTSFAQALPEPQIAGGADLTQEYDTPWAKVVSSKVTYADGTTANSDLVGFYNSLQDGYFSSGAGGGQSIITKGYNFTSSDPNSIRSANLKSCIEEQASVGCASTPQITAWNVCFAATASNQTALLTATSTPAGVTTNVNFTTCN